MVLFTVLCASVVWGVLPQPLVELSFETGSGTTVTNTGSLGGNGTFTTNSSKVPVFSATGVGVGGGRCMVNTNAVSMGGTSGYLTLGDLDALDGLKSFTITCWMKKTTNFNSRCALVNKRETNAGWELRGSTSDNMLGLVASNAVKSYQVSDATLKTTNEWIFVALTFDDAANTMQFYSGKTNQTVALCGTSTAITQSVATANVGQMVIGCGSEALGTGAFKGWIDNVRIWGSTNGSYGVLSSNQLQEVQSNDVQNLALPQDYATIPVLEVKFDDSFFTNGASVSPNFRNSNLPPSIFEGAPDGAPLAATNGGVSTWASVVGVFGKYNFLCYGKETVEVEYRAPAVLSNLTFKITFRDGDALTLTTNAVCNGTWQTLRFPVGDACKDKEIYSFVPSVKNLSGASQTLNIRTFRVWREQINTRTNADTILAVPPARNVAVSNINGAVIITIDGQPVTGGGYTDIFLSNKADSQFNATYGDILAGSSMNCHRVPVAIGYDHTRFRHPSWLGPDHFDYSVFDALMTSVVGLNPNAGVIVQCSADYAPWWSRLHPDCADPWFIPHADPGPYPTSYATSAYMPDYGSDEWRREIKDALRQFIAHVQSGPYSNNVIGYQLMGGSGYDNQYNLIPRTPRQLQRFQDSLRTKYGNNTAALTNAWRDPSVTFATALPLQMNGMPVQPDSIAYASPFAYEQPNPPGLIIVPAENARLADTMEFLRRAEETIVLDFCQTVKEATHGRRLAGAQYGNLLAAQRKREPVYRWSWKKPLEALLKSPYVDFFEQWPFYQGRAYGEVSGGDNFGDVPVCPPLGTAKNNKFIALENDYRQEPKGLPESDRDILSYYRRIFFTSLVWGMSPYLWDMGYLDKITQVLPEWHLQEDILQRAFTLDRSTGAEVAFVLDPDYTRFTGYDSQNNADSDTAGLELINKGVSDWCRSGVPFDIIYLDQLTNTPPYKVYVFFLTLGLSDAQRTNITNVTRSNNIVSIFLWADGYINDGTGAASVANISALTGMTITKITGPQKWGMTPEPWFTNTMGLASGHKLGVLPLAGVLAPRSLSAVFDPSFAVTTNATTKAIAKYDNSPGAGLVGMAVQSNSTYQVIYSGSQMIGSPVIRYACKQAGVFSYTDDAEQLLYIGNSFIGIHAAKTNAMTLTLKLPASAPLYDIYSDVERPASTNFSVPLTFKTNVLFFRGTRAQWRSGLTNSMVAKTVDECNPLNFTVVGCTTNRTPIYSLVNAPTGATIDAGTGAFSWTPPATAGSYTTNITVRVSYGTDGLYEEQVFAVAVNEANAQPVISAISGKTVDAGSTLTFTVNATDANTAQTLTWTLVNAPAGAAINANNGLFTWTPPLTQVPGDYAITVRVTDDGAPPQFDEQTFTVTVKAPGLGLLFHLNAVNGTTVQDESGSNRTGTAIGSPVLVPGISSNSMRLNGSTQYVETVAFASPTNAITVACWAKSDTNNWSSATRTFLSKRSAFLFGPAGGAKNIQIVVYTNSNWAYGPSYTVPDITQWHHYAGTYDGSALRLFVDGIQRGGDYPVSGVIPSDATGKLYVGNDDGYTNRYFKGAMDEVRLYDRALSATEIAQLVAQSAESLSSLWQTTNIGSQVEGFVVQSNTLFQVAGSGTNITGSADQFRFVYQGASADCAVTGRVISVQNTATNARAGVMIRNSLDPDSMQVSLMLTPASNVIFSCRSSTGGACTTVTDTGCAPPQWLKVQRAGDVFSAYRSTDGTTWTQVGSDQTIGMGTATCIGLLTTSLTNGVLCNGLIDNVTVTP
jgi:hypothetical protein